MPKICKVDGCAKMAVTKRLCKAHYTRLLRHGDPLAGRTPCGSLMRFITETAIPYGGDDCLIWPYGTCDNGYGQLTVDGKHISAHRYVCERVNGPAPSAIHEAAHSCGKGKVGCISPGHLSWKTPIENEADKLIHNTHIRGERHGQAKLSEDQVHQILRLKGTKSPGKIATEFGVSRANIRSIFGGGSWAWLADGDAQ